VIAIDTGRTVQYFPAPNLLVLRLEIQQALSGDHINAVTSGIQMRYVLINQRTGFTSGYLCLECLADPILDLTRDARVCPKCNSSRLARFHEMVDGPCSRCKKGTIQEIDTGILS